MFRKKVKKPKKRYFIISYFLRKLKPSKDDVLVTPSTTTHVGYSYPSHIELQKEYCGQHNEWYFVPINIIEVSAGDYKEFRRGKNQVRADD